jgi:hypothetical protein
MKKIILLVALAFVANVTNAQTVKDITTKYFEAIGGQNWEKVKSMQMFANVDNGGMKIPVEVVMMSDGRMYTRFEVQGMKFTQGAFDGETSWSTNFMTQKAEKSESDDTENTKRSAKEFPNALLTSEKLGYKTNLEGIEKIDGVECYKIKVEKKTMLSEGKEVPNIEYYYIDKETFVPIMTETEIQSGEMKGKIAQTKYSDYQEVNGVFIAFSQTSGIKDGMSQAITFDKVLINSTIDEAGFKFPK